MINACSNNSNDITYASSSSYCCPNNEIVVYEGCQDFGNFTGAGVTVLNLSLYESATVTVINDSTSGGTTTLNVASAYATVPATTVQVGGSTTIYVPKAGNATINATGFTGTICTTIFNRIPR